MKNDTQGALRDAGKARGEKHSDIQPIDRPGGDVVHHVDDNVAPGEGDFVSVSRLGLSRVEEHPGGGD